MHKTRMASGQKDAKVILVRFLMGTLTILEGSGVWYGQRHGWRQDRVARSCRSLTLFLVAAAPALALAGTDPASAAAAGGGRVMREPAVQGLAAHACGAAEGARPAAAGRVMLASDPRDVPPPLPGTTAPPPPPPSEPAMFFIERDGQPEGPLSRKQLQDRIVGGQVTPTTQVWRRGMAAWQPAGQVEELRSAFYATPPPVPPERLLARYMVGVWEQAARQAGVVVVTAIRFEADGSYAGVQRTQSLSVNHPPLTLPVSGQWRVQRIDETRFSLTMTPRDGGFPQTITLARIDENSVRNEEAGTIARRIGR